MKKLLLIAGSLMIGYVMMTSYPGSKADIRPASAQAVHSVQQTLYIVKEENDRIVVTMNDAVYLRTDTQVSSLPKNDRQKLKEGITVFSEQELKELIEDYCS